jgi:hypothetical protein
MDAALHSYPLKDDSWTWQNLLYKTIYCIIDTKNCLSTNKLFYCFKHHGLSYYNILLYQLYNKTLFHIPCTDYNITIYCHLRMLFINNLLYHSNIMIVYYNQCAFYFVTIDRIKQKNILTATTAASTLPPLPRCCHAVSITLSQPLLLLPLRLCCRFHLSAIASAPPLPHLCSAALLLCRRCHCCSAANTAMPPLLPSCHPATLLLAAAEVLPQLPPPPLLCCCCCTAAMLPPLLCLHRCCRPASLPSCYASAVSLSLLPPFCRLRHLAPL